LLHPVIAKLDCDYCQTFVHDPDTYLIELGRDGKPERRDSYGLGVCPPNCMTERGCPKGTPDNQRTLNDQSRECWEHYKECRAVGQFPDDPIVRRNAAAIREVEDMCAEIRQRRNHNELIQLMFHKGEQG